MNRDSYLLFVGTSFVCSGSRYVTLYRWRCHMTMLINEKIARFNELVEGMEKNSLSSSELKEFFELDAEIELLDYDEYVRKQERLEEEWNMD